MDRFSEIQAFLAVCETGSFTRAAESLSLSRSRISQLVAELEDRLGVTLLHRTTRVVQLTPEGEHFRVRCQSGIRQLESAEVSLKLMSERLSGPVRINSVGGLIGEYYVARVLTEVAAQHPSLNIHLEYSSQRVDLNQDPVDLVIRGGDDPGPHVEAERIGQLEFMLCASPRYLNQVGFPRHPDELSNFNCLRGTPRVWRFHKGNETVEHQPEGNWFSPSSQAQLLAAEQGLGIARLSNLVLREPLQQGRVIQVLNDWRIANTSLWLVWAERTELPKRVRTVRDHLIRRFHSFDLGSL
ncbi:LysR family transcriptional regulator [Saccharospirillum salsuginis]|uniref:LysR family transcriptional regulator n=1 Tax=Saccharospirillum salsuginis TaxID=418750 RepID=A0A918K5N8_9GAMM|nr:LysR family transcriptional regulator [Saccharospirillum salsuginis]GGX48054.1 LysR family transcriptional regulator [Saccharospirillum salsuginis]